MICTSACAVWLLVGQAVAQDLRFEFTIDAQIAGSRPWDYSGVSSSAIDDLEVGSALIGDNIFGSAADAILGTAVDTAVDQLQTGFAPPDPYLCVIAINGRLPNNLREFEEIYVERDFNASCTPQSEIKPNRTQFYLDLPPNIARHEIFGVVLVDSDAQQFFQDGGRFEDADDGDEVIGFGLYINDVLSASVRNREEHSIELVTHYEQRLPDVVQRMFRFNARSHLELEKISMSLCENSCSFGSATLTIKDTPGGW